MPVDMKEMIAGAAKYLLMEKKVDKLTVKDIVEECRITRQAFYYHFEDIPALIRWMLERDTERMVQQSQALEDPEQALRDFFLMAINAGPYVKKALQSNYGDELARLLEQYVYRLFEQAIESENLYQNYTHLEVKVILRYHSQAIMGLLRGWTPEDTKHLEQIVHLVYLMLEGQISPHGQ